MFSKMFFYIKCLPLALAWAHQWQNYNTITNRKFKTPPMSFLVSHHETNSNCPIFNSNQPNLILPYNDNTNLLTLSYTNSTSLPLTLPPCTLDFLFKILWTTKYKIAMLENYYKIIYFVCCKWVGCTSLTTFIWINSLPSWVTSCTTSTIRNLVLCNHSIFNYMQLFVICNYVL
jgi:hypothetical protein